MRPAQWLLLIASFTMLVEPLADGWLGLGLAADQHVLSPLWPPHAKFHVVRQGVSAVLLCAVAVYGLWHLWDKGRAVRWGFAMIPLIHHGGGLLALALMAPAYGVHNPVPVPRLGGPSIVLSLLLIGLAAVFDWRAEPGEARAADSPLAARP